MSCHVSAIHLETRATHTTTLSVKVGADLLLESGTVDVTGTDGDSHSLGNLIGLAGDVLVNGVRSVDTATLEEEGTDGTAGTLGSDEDNVNVLGGDNAGLVGVNDRETVSKVKSLALGDEGLNLLPSLGLGGIREQVHDDGTLVDSLGDIEQSLSWNPTVLDSLLPRSTVLTDTDDNVQALVTSVEGLTVTLRAVTDHGKGLTLEVVLELLSGPVGTLVDGLLGTGKVEGLDTTDGLEGNKRQLTFSPHLSTESTHSNAGNGLTSDLGGLASEQSVRPLSGGSRGCSLDSRLE
jgi:hypothetical protein